MSRFSVPLAALLAALLCMTPPAAAKDGRDLRRFAARLDLAAEGQRHAYVGAAELRLGGRIERDAWVAGAVVEITADVGDDVHAYGATVAISGPAGGDVTAWAARLAVTSPRIGDDLDGHASTITIGPGTAIAGMTRLVGSRIVFAGSGTGRIQIHGEEVEFSGTASGPVEIVATKVRITAAARLAAGLTVFTIGEPVIEPGAVVDGIVTTKSLYEAPAMRPYLQGELMQQVRLALILGASGLVAGMGFLLFGRGAVEDSVDNLVDHPGQSALWGLGALVVLPLSAVVLALSFVGIPLAVTIVLALPILFLLGFASAGFGAGEWLFNRVGEPVTGRMRGMLLMAGLAALALATLVPFAGLAVVAIAAVLGLGAFLRTLYGRMRGTDMRPDR